MGSGVDVRLSDTSLPERVNQAAPLPNSAMDPTWFLGSGRVEPDSSQTAPSRTVETSMSGPSSRPTGSRISDRGPAGTAGVVGVVTGGRSVLETLIQVAADPGNRQQQDEHRDDRTDASPTHPLRQGDAHEVEVRRRLRIGMGVQSLGELLLELLVHASPPSRRACFSLAMARDVWVFTEPGEQPMAVAVSATVRSA